MGKNLDKVYGSLQRMWAMIFDLVYLMAKHSFDTLSTNSSIFSSFFCSSYKNSYCRNSSAIPNLSITNF